MRNREKKVPEKSSDSVFLRICLSLKNDPQDISNETRFHIGLATFNLMTVSSFCYFKIMLCTIPIFHKKITNSAMAPDFQVIKTATKIRFYTHQKEEATNVSRFPWIQICKMSEN